MGGFQTVHGNLALCSAELECGGSGRRSGVDDLDEVVFKLATVLERAANKVGVGRSRTSVQTRAGEIEDGGDAVRLDRFAAEVLRTLEICKRFGGESIGRMGDHVWY